MPEITISGLIAGGKATAGPPFGPALGPLGVNIAKIIEEINAKTNQFDGINVPVKVTVDTGTKVFKIEVGMPPTSALILKEIGIKLGAKAKGEIVGNLTLEQAKKIAASKEEKLYGKTIASRVNQVLGTCKSMGVTCENQDPRAVIRKINSGETKL
jgi:large subunit ribosomal protein L11